MTDLLCRQAMQPNIGSGNIGIEVLFQIQIS